MFRINTLSLKTQGLGGKEKKVGLWDEYIYARI